MKCPPRPTAFPFSTDNPISFHQKPLGNYSVNFTGFCNWSTYPCPPTLFKPSLSTMSYYNNTALNYAMKILLRKISTRQASSFYKVPYRKILNATTALESTQEQWVTPMVENDNQQQIYRWVRKYLLLPLCIGDYMDWELRQSVKERILLKSGCTVIHDNFGVPKTPLQRYLNVIFPLLKCSLLNHLWYLTSLGETNNKSVRNMITEKLSNQNLDRNPTF